MKLAALFSGGKDSTLAIHKAVRSGHRITSLVSVIPDNPESYMFHYPNISFTKLQAEAAGIPLITQRTKGEKEKELKDLKKAITSVKNEIGGVVTGAIASNYQYERVKRICEVMKLKLLSPLWQMNPETIWNQLLRNGFEVIITSVSCEGLGKEWLGRKIDKENLNELKELSEKFSFHLGFEGGEAETFVTNCPLFRKKILVKESETVWDRESESGCFVIREAALK